MGARVGNGRAVGRMNGTAVGSDMAGEVAAAVTGRSAR